MLKGEDQFQHWELGGGTGLKRQGAKHLEASTIEEEVEKLQWSSLWGALEA